MAAALEVIRTKLFNKPLSDLREVFVRARFAEEQVFGDEDIEKWEHRQWSSEHPSQLATWENIFNNERILQLGSLIDPASLVANFGRPTPRSEIRHPGQGDLAFDQVISPFIMLASGSSMNDGSKYPGTDSPFFCYGTKGKEPIIVFRIGDKWHGYFLKWQSGKYEVILRPLDIRQALDHLLQAWINGSQETKIKARGKLCGVLRDRINEERTRAQEDYDEAVAVSEDGKQIVSAHNVVVFDTRSKTVLRFPGDAFKDRKILLRDMSKPMEGDIRVVMSMIDQGVAEQSLMRSDWLFVTPLRFCPDPLPEGGVTVTY